MNHWIWLNWWHSENSIADLNYLFQLMSIFPKYFILVSVCWLFHSIFYRLVFHAAKVQVWNMFCLWYIYHSLPSVGTLHHNVSIHRITTSKLFQWTFQAENQMCKVLNYNWTEEINNDVCHISRINFESGEYVTRCILNVFCNMLSFSQNKFEIHTSLSISTIQLKHEI